MTNVPKYWESRFIELDGASRAFFWTPGHLGGECSRWFLMPSCLVMLYLVANLSHVGADVDRVACSLHRPTVCGWQTRYLCCLTGVVTSHRPTVGGGPFPVVRSPWAWIFDVVLTIWIPVRPNLIWRSMPLSGRDYLMSELSWWFMCVLLVQLLCQAAMGWIPTLECLLSGACGACSHVLSC
jgi:hypothetical protein